VNNPDFEGSVESAAKAGRKKSALATANATGTGTGKVSSQQARMDRCAAELQQQEQDPTIVKLGDASIASPFTARRTSIDSGASRVHAVLCCDVLCVPTCE